MGLHQLAQVISRRQRTIMLRQFIYAAVCSHTQRLGHVAQSKLHFRITLISTQDNTEVEFTLRDMSKPLGVATYRSVDELPEHYRALPSADELRKLM